MLGEGPCRISSLYGRCIEVFFSLSMPTAAHVVFLNSVNFVLSESRVRTKGLLTTRS